MPTWPARRSAAARRSRFRGRLRTDDGADRPQGGRDRGDRDAGARSTGSPRASGARPTLERLSDAARAGTLSRSAAEILAESFRFLIRLRLQEQLRSARSGEEPSNRVRVDALTELERRRLVEAFEAVRKLQDATALRFDTGGLA